MLAAGGVLLTHALLEYPHAYAYFCCRWRFSSALSNRATDGGRKPDSSHRLELDLRAFSASMAALLIWVCPNAESKRRTQSSSRRPDM